MSNQPAYRIYVCHGAFCRGDLIYRSLQHLIGQHQRAQQCELRASGCQNRCDDGPNITIWPGPIRYHHVQVSELDDIVRTHFLGHTDHSHSAEE